MSYEEDPNKYYWRTEYPKQRKACFAAVKRYSRALEKHLKQARSLQIRWARIENDYRQELVEQAKRRNL